MNPWGTTRGSASGAARPDWPLAVLGALAIGLIAIFAVESAEDEAPPPHPTIGPSMTPTIVPGSLIEVDAHAYDGSSPQVGDIVGFQGPANLATGVCGAAHPPGSPCPVTAPGYEQVRLVKRVVAGPGDRIAFTADGHSIRNGQLADEPFISPCAGGCALPNPIVVPDGHYFMAGDNRPLSTDSRVFGAVPVEAVDGRVVLDSSSGGS